MVVFCDRVQARVTIVALAAVVAGACSAHDSVHRVPPVPSESPAKISDLELPLEQPTDVRWEDAEHVLISDRRQGIARVRIDGTEPRWLSEWPRAQGIGSQYIHFGASSSYIATADIAFGVRWRERREDAPDVEAAFEYIADLDVHGELLLVSGLRRDAAGTVGGDGSTAWTGSMRQGIADFRPVLPIRNAKAIQDCAGFGLASVRFFQDGSAMIVPGAEPGIYLYDTRGRLARTWDTKMLDVEVDCDLAPEQRALATDADARQGWLNARRFVDDVIALERTPALIARSRTASETRWEIIVLRPDAYDVIRLPFTSSSPWAHISADFQDGKIAFVISDRLAGRPDGDRPRLVIAPWPLS